jgi:hypothetical protein
MATEKPKVPKMSITFATELEKMLAEDAMAVDLKTTEFEIQQVQANITARNRADYTAAVDPYLKNLQEKHAYILQMQAKFEKEIFVTLPTSVMMGKGGQA